MQNALKLNNGVEIPILGFGTFQITDPKEAEESVMNAINAGYRHIDTAQSYLNEEADTIPALKEEGIQPEAWAPFAEGKNNLFHNSVLTSIADKYNKTVGQVVIRWLVEQEVVVLAKTAKPERLQENLDVFDFQLSNEDKKQIATLNIGESQFFSHADPEQIKSLAARKLDV